MPDYYCNSIEEYLRQPGGRFYRSSYAVEPNPWSRKGEIEAALLFRGTLVSAYGFIETRLRELALRTSHLPQCKSIFVGLPFREKSLLTYLRAAFAQEPLKQFQCTAESFLSRFEAAGDLRHMAAHARMQVLPGWGVVLEHFPKGGSPSKPLIERRRYPLADLELEARRAARLSRLGDSLMAQLIATGLLPEI